MTQDASLELVMQEVLESLQKNLERFYVGETPQDYMLSLVPLAKDVVSCYRNGNPLEGELSAVAVRFEEYIYAARINLEGEDKNRGVSVRLGRVVGELSDEKPAESNVIYIGHAVLVPNFEYSNPGSVLLDVLLDPKSEPTTDTLRRSLIWIMGLKEVGVVAVPKNRMGKKGQIGVYKMKR